MTRQAQAPVLGASTAHATLDRAGDHLTVAISGELDADSTPGIADRVRAQILPTDEHVWIDLSATTFCDSTGIAMLARLHEVLDTEDSHRLVVWSPTPQVRRVLDITGLDRLIAVRV